MEEYINPIKRMMLGGALAQKVRAWLEIFKSYYEQHKDLLRLAGLFFLIAFPLVCAKSLDKKFIDKDIGYEITGPRFWHMSVASDNRSVTYRKFANPPKLGNSSIRFEVKIDKGVGQTAINYTV